MSTSQLTKNRPAAGASSHSAAGFTLMEMMIALSLSVIVLGAAFNYFNDAEGMTQSVSAMSQVNENLRGGADLMTRDLYAAGTGVPVSGIPLPNFSGSVAVKRPGPGSATFPISTNNGVLSVITPGQGLSGVIDAQVYAQASDEITILKEDPAWTNQTWDATTQNWTVQSLSVATTTFSGHTSGEITYSAGSGYTVTATFPSSCTPCRAISVGDLLLFSTVSEGYALGMVTTAPGFTTSSGTTTATLTFGDDSLGLNQACGSVSPCAGTIDSLRPNPATLPSVYPTQITLTKIDMITYYLTNSNTAHPYTLMRVLGSNISANNSTNAVAYGIGQLSLTYDAVSQASPPQLDASDPNPTCASTQCPNQIRTVHLTLGAISSIPLRKSGQYYQNSIISSITLQNMEYSNQF
jgi:prepilin-type N-terminal cleavage/methylation domain-containing protein